MIRPEEAIYRFLDTNGDGSGTENANGNYASAAEEFYYEAPKSCFLYRMIVSISDTSGMQVQDYGNITSGLTNGVRITVDDGSTTLNELDGGLPVQTNGDWARLCYDSQVLTWGSGNEYLIVRWTFARAGDPLYLAPGYRLVVTLNDDLTGLLSHYFMVQGGEAK